MKTMVVIPACVFVALLLAAPRPVLNVSPTTVTVTGTAGAPVPSASVSIRNAGNGALRWTVDPPKVTWAVVSPQSGTNGGAVTISFPATFAAGTYSTAFVVSGAGRSETVTVAVSIAPASSPQPPSPSPPTPTPTTGYGPQPTIVCPAGAVSIAQGASIQAAVAAAPGGTTFCLRAGTHSITSAITPKSGDTFVGEYGAVLDGSGWSTSDSTQAAFRAHNQDIDDVTIRNLVIRNMPQRGVHAFHDFSDRWLIEFVEISGCHMGINAPSGSRVAHSYIHDNISATPDDPNPANRGGGYMAYQSVGTVFEANEIARNGAEQKIVGSRDVAFLGNFVHDNYRDGIWYDGDNAGAVIEANRLEHNGRHGIDYEISGSAIIRSNTVNGSGDNGIFISISHDVEIAGNTLSGNFRGIQYFLDCGRLDGVHDLARVNAHDNVIAVPSTAGAFANGFNNLSTCTADQIAPYVGGQKALTFTSNHYTVPTLSGRWWIWGGGHLVDWTGWHSAGQDLTGSVQ